MGLNFFTKPFFQGILPAFGAGVAAALFLSPAFAGTEYVTSYRGKIVNDQLDIVEGQLEEYSRRKAALEARPLPPRAQRVERAEYSPPAPKKVKIAGPVDDTLPSENIAVEDPSPVFSFMKDFDYLDADVRFTTGRRVDDLAWGVAGNNSGANPNRDNDTEWNKVNIFQIMTDGRLRFNNGALVEGGFAWGNPYDGETLETRYAQNDRTDIIQQISGFGGNGSTWDFSIGAGWEFPIEKGWFEEVTDVTFTPLLGYSFHNQEFEATKGVQLVDEVSGLPLGPFSGLNNSYEAEWDGIWLGMELSGRLKKLLTTFRFQYHYFDYSGEGTYNLRTDLASPSFRHNADGYGLTFGLDFDYELTESLSLNFLADLRDWRADPGSDILYMADGTQTDQRLNEAVLKSYALMMGATYKFE